MVKLEGGRHLQRCGGWAVHYQGIPQISVEIVQQIMEIEILRIRTIVSISENGLCV